MDSVLEERRNLSNGAEMIINKECGEVTIIAADDVDFDDEGHPCAVWHEVDPQERNATVANLNAAVARHVASTCVRKAQKRGHVSTALETTPD